MIVNLSPGRPRPTRPASAGAHAILQAEVSDVLRTEQRSCTGTSRASRPRSAQRSLYLRSSAEPQEECSMRAAHVGRPFSAGRVRGSLLVQPVDRIRPRTARPRMQRVNEGAGSGFDVGQEAQIKNWERPEHETGFEHESLHVAQKHSDIMQVAQNSLATAYRALDGFSFAAMAHDRAYSPGIPQIASPTQYTVSTVLASHEILSMEVYEYVNNIKNLTNLA